MFISYQRRVSYNLDFHTIIIDFKSLSELHIMWVNVGGVIHDCIVVLHNKVRVVPRVQLPSGTEHPMVVKPVERVRNHMQSQSGILNLVVCIWNESHVMCLADHMEVNIGCIGTPFNSHGQIELELSNFIPIDTDLAVIGHRNIEVVISTLSHVQVARTSSARPCDWLIGEEVTGHFGDHLIQITCIELEKSRLPVLAVQLYIQVSVVNSISEGVSVDIESNEFLNSTIDSKYCDRYLGLSGREGA